MTTQTLRLSWPEDIVQGVAFAEGTDDIDVTFVVDHDAEIRQILLSKPSGAGASALLTSGESLLTTAPAGVTAELLDVTAIASVTNAIIGAGRILQREGRGRLRFQTSGAVAGQKRICILLSPIRRGG